MTSFVRCLKWSLKANYLASLIMIPRIQTEELITAVA